MQCFITFHLHVTDEPTDRKNQDYSPRYLSHIECENYVFNVKFIYRFIYILLESLLASAIYCDIHVMYTCTRFLYPESFGFDLRALSFMNLAVINMCVTNLWHWVQHHFRLLKLQN